MKFSLFFAILLSVTVSNAVLAAPLTTVVVSAPKSAVTKTPAAATKAMPASKPAVTAKGEPKRPAGSVSAIDLNSADAATLAREMQGIGQSKARAIVEYRRVHGPFRSIDDLALVKGIGARTIELNRAKLRLGSVAASRSLVR